MKILVCGYYGFMGQEVVKLCNAGYRGATLAGGVDLQGDALVYPRFADVPNDLAIDCVVDFSHHSATPDLLAFARKRHLPVVLATTGHTPEEAAQIAVAGKEIPVFFSANMSLGVALLVELAKTTAMAMPEAEIEIVEKHHNRKLDAPSGTALMLANAICDVQPARFVKSGRSGQGKRDANEIGVHAIRMGNIVGEHEVIVGTANQTITLKHEAHSRALFAEGALAAAAFLVTCGAGVYDMQSLILAQKKG